MTGKEIAKYLVYAPDDVDLVVLPRAKYDKLMKKAFFYDDLRKYFEKHLTTARVYGIIKTEKEKEGKRYGY